MGPCATRSGEYMRGMRTWRHRIADAIRLLGVALMIIIAALATSLEWVGILDIALLPYFLAFAAYCVADIVAEVIGNGPDLLRGTHTRTQ